jgi:benzoyl-CoA reductase/2-hydroxyglutaryl-CoA dehydratase subunit BcrC/BadD/HgdB
VALRDLIEKRKAQGMMFVGEKYCEYEYLEIPFLRKMLATKNIANLEIEIAVDDADNVEALRTRIEAFSELL